MTLQHPIHPQRDIVLKSTLHLMAYDMKSTRPSPVWYKISRRVDYLSKRWSSLPTSSAARRTFDDDHLDEQQKDGFAPSANDKGNWVARTLRDNVYPGTAPSTIEHVATFIAPGTVVTFDNGCFPSLEWRFDGKSMIVFDTFDYLDGTPDQDRGSTTNGNLSGPKI